MVRARWMMVVTALLAVTASAQTGRTLAVKPAVGPLAGRELYTNSHALLIGVSKYQHLPADKRLQFADKDALALREVLIKSYGFPAENITLLLDDRATKAAIEEALSTLSDPERVKENDRILIYFSGHGQTVTLPDKSEMGFLIPHDARVELQKPASAAPYLSTCVEMEGLWKYLRGCAAKHALVLTDACFSGLLVQARSLGEREKLNANELAKQAARPARQVLTAGGKGEEAFEDPKLGHGAFTYKLLEELRAEAAVAGEVFTATDLAAVLKRSVSNLTDGKQSPVFGSYRTEGEFLFVTTPPSTVSPAVVAVRDPARPMDAKPAEKPTSKLAPPIITSPEPSATLRLGTELVVSGRGTPGSKVVVEVTYSGKAFGALPVKGTFGSQEVTVSQTGRWATEPFPVRLSLGLTKPDLKIHAVAIDSAKRESEPEVIDIKTR